MPTLFTRRLGVCQLPRCVANGIGVIERAVGQRRSAGFLDARAPGCADHVLHSVLHALR